MSFPGNRAAYRIGEAAELLSVSRSTIYRLIKRGELNTITIRSELRVAASEIQRFINEHRSRNVSNPPPIGECWVTTVPVLPVEPHGAAWKRGGAE